MSTLSEIEEAADVLPLREKQELVFFLLTRLRSDGAEWPAPRVLPKEQIEGWIADDEAGYKKYLAGSEDFPRFECSALGLPFGL